MAVAKQFQQLVKITNGTTAETDVKLSDPLAMQHIDITSGANSLNQISLAQSMCQPVAVTPNSTPSGGAYTATCSNYPDFSLTYTDKNGNTHYLVGIKVRVIFTKGITYGSVSGGTYPTLNINSSGAIPLLAQGKTMAAGAAVDGQSLELTLIPYGNGVAWDADSNVRESTSDYTIYTDGNEVYTLNKTATLLSSKANIQIYGNTSNYLNNTNKYLRINTNLANSDIGYYRTIPILLCSNSADVVAVANITRGDAGVGVTLSYITNNNTLSYVKTQIEDGKQILYFQTTKTWAHLYSAYNLVGIQPELSAVSSIPE